MAPFRSLPLALVIALAGCARATATFEDASVSPVGGDDGELDPDAGSIEVPSDEDDVPTDDGAPTDDGTPADDGGELDAALPDPPDDDDDGPAPEEDAAVMPVSECKAGTYRGTFNGNIAAFFIINIPISGTIAIDVITSGDDPEMLVIDNGKVVGTDDDGNPVNADVFGMLRCSTKTLEGGELRNGVYVRQSINQTVNFSGTVQAVYHAGDPPSVSGTWSTQGGVESGSGPFNAVFAQ
jgi:hypothetical protein